MKTKRLAALLSLMPLTLLAACGGGTSALPLSANWYRNTTSSSIEGTSETLEYTVRFVPPEKQDTYHVVYNDGTYRTELISREYLFEDGFTTTVYCYTTELTISGYYTDGNVNSAPFEDFSRYTVYFRGISENLSPIKSTKEMKSTIPVNKPTEEKLFDTVHFSYDVTYNTHAVHTESVKSAAVKLTVYGDGEDERVQEESVKLDYAGTFLDNEQILFAMRGLDMTSTFSMTTLNLQNNRSVKVHIPSTPTETELNMADLTANGELLGEVTDGQSILTVAAYNVPYVYDTDQSGPTRTAYYAKRVSAENNTYRNVLLRLDDAIPGGYGTLRYTLKNATFNEK